VKTVTLDFETAWDKLAGYTLSSMTTQQYITDPRFEVIGVGVQWAPGAEPVWVTGANIDVLMDQLRKEQDNIVLQAHNTMFDGAILGWVYNVHPAFLVDTLSLARTLGLQATVGGSLAKLADQARAVGMSIPPKGDEVHNTSGKWAKDFSAEELRRYGAYCVDDVRITSALAAEFKALTPMDEMVWQSKVLQMYTRPMLHVNAEVVTQEAARVKVKRALAKQKLMTSLGVNDEALLVSVLNSNDKFAQAVELYGGVVPTKTSKATGKPAYALGIKDPEFVSMLDHPIDEVRELVTARMGLKSSIEQSRCEHMAWLAQFPVVPVPYKISGARTHRLGGGEGEQA
jgi:DNA polymerase